MNRRPHNQVFARGQFLGDCHVSRAVPGFCLEQRIPTVPEPLVQEHSHAEAHFLLFTEGTYLSTAHGAPALAARPMLIYNPPGTVHRDCFKSESGRFFTISVSAAALQTSAVALPNYALVLDAPSFDLALRIARVCEEATSEPLQLESLCLELLVSTAGMLEAVVAGAPRWLLWVRELLRDECDRDLALTDIAKRVGVHPVYMTRAFRRHFRCTPGGYLRRCRLDKASALLADTHKSLADVAQSCGYYDQAHFCRVFKQAYGVSPSAYRSDGSGFAAYKTMSRASANFTSD